MSNIEPKMPENLITFIYNIISNILFSYLNNTFKKQYKKVEGYS